MKPRLLNARGKWDRKRKSGDTCVDQHIAPCVLVTPASCNIRWKKKKSEVQTGSRFLIAKGQERRKCAVIFKTSNERKTGCSHRHKERIVQWMAERRGLPLPSSSVNTVKTDAERKQGQKWQSKKKGRCASFYLLHWTRSIFPRGDQSEYGPLSWPANGKTGPSDRHCIQPRGVGHRGGACTRSCPRANSCQSLLHMFGELNSYSGI